MVSKIHETARLSFFCTGWHFGRRMGLGLGMGSTAQTKRIEQLVNGVFWWLDNKYPGSSIKIIYLGIIKREYQQYQSHGI